MLQGSEVAAALADQGFTHVVWIPDSHLGTWEAGLLAEKRLSLIRVSREGEAIGVAAGLLLGGKKPIVVIQCTGLFEAGDALRNVAHDLKLPLRLIVGVRGWNAAQQGPIADTCPRFIEPFVDAWAMPSAMLGEERPAAFRAALAELDSPAAASLLLLPE